MNVEEFIRECNKLNISLDDKTLSNLNTYKDYLKEYNSHTNLTTITEDEDIYLKHFYDSLTIIKAIDLNSINSLIDVGTGAGFPGMVLKIVFPHLNVTLIDSNNKKTTFLSNLKDKLNLDNLNIINERSEDYAHKHIDEYDVVTSRAVANLRVLTELCLPMVKVGGKFIPLKATVDEEIKEANNIINILNGKLNNIITFNLPKEESLRNILVIDKLDKTPKGYPRNYGKIKKGN